MLRFVFVTAVAVAVAASALGQHPAAADEAPWCKITSQGYWDCQYGSVEACVASGTRGGFCNPNPRYQGAKPSERKRRTSRRK
jgi:hypothetical protein